MSLHSPKAFDKMDYWIFSMNKNFFLQKLSAVTISQNKRWKRYTKVAAILKMGKKQDGKFFRGKFHHGIFYSHLKHRGKYISGGALYGRRSITSNLARVRFWWIGVKFLDLPYIFLIPFFRNVFFFFF